MTASMLRLNAAVTPALSLCGLEHGRILDEVDLEQERVPAGGSRLGPARAGSGGASRAGSCRSWPPRKAITRGPSAGGARRGGARSRRPRRTRARPGSARRASRLIHAGPPTLDVSTACSGPGVPLARMASSSSSVLVGAPSPRLHQLRHPGQLVDDGRRRPRGSPAPRASGSTSGSFVIASEQARALGVVVAA